ncbi:MAG TPA: serine/threonine-protein kinase [Kofleriaceae bacterium]|nr:serine/threonine-protein kinase [Kofleriaceae bacterium]
MGRAAVALGAILIVGGGAALGYALTRKPAPAPGLAPEAASAMASAIAKLEGDLRDAHARAAVRAQTIAVNQYVKTAIDAGDVETAKDMVVRGELKFDPQGGEVIELGVIDGKPLVLVRQPDTAPISGLTTPGSYADLDGDRAVIREVAAVKGKSKTGFVTVTQPQDLKPTFDQLAAAGIAGTFELAGKQRAIGSAPANAQLDARPLAEPGAKLVVAMPAKAASGGGMPLPIVGAGAGAATLGLILVIAGMMTRKRATAAPSPIQLQPTVESLPPDTTRFTGPHGVAAGTPSPVASGGAAIPPHDLAPGAMIGRWEVIRRLGSGGMADVYLAHSKGEAGFEKLVAIKVMHPHLARNERAVEHFLDEARLAARIHHPNVVAIQDLGKIGTDYVIVMEFVEGVDLERLLISARNGNRLVPVEVGLAILCKVCDGLTAAHQATATDGTPLGIIHRDVKSANVLVSRQGIVKVVDFGIAKAANQTHKTVAGETKGTPSMMAPEQRVGEAVDVRADVYSVAAVGYEILTGHGVNLDLAALAHLGVENWPHLPLPSSLRPNLPTELDEILLTAMAFDRERRPADCAAFETQLEAVIKKHGLTASDKDIARWVDSELRQLVPAFEGVSSGISKPVTP